MSKRAEEAARKAYNRFTAENIDDVLRARHFFQEGYEQAEKDLAPAFEYPFEVPDNDGYLVFTPMNNQTIRKELKLKKGEGIIISIRKEK